MAQFQAISKATNEAELTAAKAMSVSASAIPAELSEVGADIYLKAPATASSASFQKDPSAWQNMEYGAYVSQEMGRDVTWPFIVGAAVTYLLLGVMLPGALPASSKETSKYMKMIEGNKSEH
jgi:hypothetical protein